MLSVIDKPRIRNAKSIIHAASSNRVNTVLLLRKEVTTDVRLFLYLRSLLRPGRVQDPPM